MALVELDNVWAGYQRDQPVLQQISLTVGDGEFLGLIGPNGCGKSTLIRAITGVVPLIKGTVKVQGVLNTAINQRQMARCMAVVPQESQSTFAFTVREVVMMGRHAHLGRFRSPGLADEEYVETALNLTATQHLAKRRLNQLSGGERQRVIIARALAQGTNLMLLDEPTNHLDINHQIEVFDLLYRLNQERGMAFLCITHDLNFAAEYCSRLVMMRNGRVYCEGSPAEVINSESIQTVYRAEVEVDENVGGRPRVVLKRKLAEQHSASEKG
jgi:iron complex transport system ATP-binding protein